MKEIQSGDCFTLKGGKNTWDLKIHFLFKNETFSPLNREEVKNSDNLNPTFLNSAGPSHQPSSACTPTPGGSPDSVASLTAPPLLLSS